MFYNTACGGVTQRKSSTKVDILINKVKKLVRRTELQTESTSRIPILLGKFQKFYKCNFD